MAKLSAFLGGIVIIAILITGLSMITAFPVMWLVNALFAPSALIAVFGTAKIGFWQAFMLAVLCGALFKSTSSSK